ncbi:MAG TPA: ABC transporter substrate-binding protein, partial [Thermomicrobiaceae bacterium]|nr:ABC transporter substrate-binding protein [Thermomicrobiaceae bacterium]
RYSAVVNHVLSVSSSDDQTVTVELGQPDAAFLTTIATYGIVPWHVLGDVLPEEQITNPFGSSSAVGTGPFSLVARDLGHEIIFQRNPSYFRGPAAVQQYVYRMVASDSDLLAGVANGSIHWAFLDPAAYVDATKSAGLTVDTLSGYDLSYVALQLDPAKSLLFQDQRVRQALMLALDRPAATRQFFSGQAQVADGVEPPASWAYTASGPVYRQQLAQARQLLDAAGWIVGSDGIRAKGGRPFRFTLMTDGTNPTRRAVAGWLAKSWRAIGLDVTVDFEQASTVQQQLAVMHDFDAILTGYRGSLDPDQTQLWASESRQGGLNAGSYSNAVVDQDLSQALGTDSRSERLALYQQISKQVMTDLPVLPLWFPSTIVVRGQRLRSVPLTAILIENRADIATWKPSGGP